MLFYSECGQKVPHPLLKKINNLGKRKGSIQGQIPPQGGWIGWLAPPPPFTNQKNENKHIKIENKDNESE